MSPDEPYEACGEARERSREDMRGAERRREEARGGERRREGPRLAEGSREEPRLAEECEERGEAREGVRSKEVAALCGVSLRRRAYSLSRQAPEELEAPYLPISPHISPYLRR